MPGSCNHEIGPFGRIDLRGLEEFVKMPNATAKELSSLIDRLKRDRQQHVDAIAEIDSIFQQYGISAEGAPSVGKRRPGRPPGSGSRTKPGRRGRKRTRGKFATSGNDSVLSFVKAAGKKGVSSADVAKHWSSEGRAGGPFVALRNLETKGEIKRSSVPGQRGSRYTSA